MNNSGARAPFSVSLGVHINYRFYRTRRRKRLSYAVFRSTIPFISIVHDRTKQTIIVHAAERYSEIVGERLGAPAAGRWITNHVG